MRLVDLNPVFLHHGGEGLTLLDGTPIPLREGCGLSFDCPCGKCGLRCSVLFSNPFDGGPPISPSASVWHRVGGTFDTLTLTPSILRRPERGGCGWHGFITKGEVLTC